MKILFTGDILIYESQDKGCFKDGKRDYSPIFAQVKPLLDDADYVVGSLETTLSGAKAGYTNASYSFNTPDELLPALKWAGFDMLTTANNHCFDRGFEGHARTIEMLEKNGFDYTGTRLSNDAPRYLLKDFDGTKVAFVAYTYGTNSEANGVFVPKGKEYLVNLTRQQDPVIHRPLWKRAAKALLSRLRRSKNTSGIIGDCVSASEINSGRNTAFESAMLETIKQAKQEADIVIMCLHSGGQFNSKVEDYTQHLFDIVVDAGADAIVCNHAHTTLPIYKQGNCLIASALGNFSFAPGEGYWVDGVKAEYSALLMLKIDDKKITSHSVTICKCVRNEKGLAVTIPGNDLEEKVSIKKRIINTFNMNNVSIIVGQNMCCSCASCAEVCPKGAITYQLSKGIYSPIIDEQKCVDCGICLKVCPAAIEEKTPVRLKSDMFDWKEKECYIAHCKDEVVRHRSKSGGVVTTMATKLLNDGVYERAFLLEYEGTEGKASLSVFKKGDDIKRAANSKYIPVSIDKVIAAIRDNEITKSIVVGTPCHMRAVKAAMQLYKRNEDEVLLIGLFCNKVFTYDVFRYYEKYYGPFEKFHFCDKESGGWPGGSWYVKDGCSGTIPRKERMVLRDYYSLNKCRFCGNQMNNQADISLGDCYVKGKDSPLGNSSVVIRTEKGQSAFNYCKGDFVLEIVSFQQIKSSQTLFEKVPNVIRPQNEPYTKEVIMAEDVSDSGLEAVHKEVEKRKNEYNNTMSQKIKGRLINYFKKSKAPVFLIRSGGFLNKGSDMMRRITINQIKLFYPNAIIAVTHYVWNENPEECKREGLVMMIGGLRYEKIKKIVPEYILRKKYVTPKMVDVVLDVSGFTYGDAWASKVGDLETEKLFWSHFTKPNKKVILLPQAFGPFNNEWSKKTMAVAYNAASIIYARENVSMDILKKMFPGDNKILLAPDFTANLNANTKIPVDIKPKSYCLVVPNQRMVDRTKADVGNSYKQYMIKVVKFLISKGENVVLFNHEGKGDELLMYEINKEFDNKLMTVTGLDGLETKTFIGNAKLLISSRFHGVVSGLCQQVPTFCTSWNHKYEELLKDYRCEGNILDVNDITKTETIIADALENPDKYISPKEAIENIKNLAQQMWCDVFYYIKNGSMKNL